MEGNLRRGRPTVCISEAFDFLNDPEYGGKSVKDGDPLDHRLKKSVSDTGIITGKHANDFKHTPLLEKNTYTILTFVQGDQANGKTTLTNSFEDQTLPIESESDEKNLNQFTIVTCVDKSGDEHVGETTHSHTAETTSPQERETIHSYEKEQNSREFNSNNGKSTNQNGGILENGAQAVYPSQSASSVSQTHSLIQNGVAKSVININHSPKSEFNEKNLVTEGDKPAKKGNDETTSVIGSEQGYSQLKTDLVSQTETDDQEVGSHVCIDNHSSDIIPTEPSKDQDTSDHDDEKVVRRPPSLTGPVTASRRTHQIVSDAFHFLKDIDNDSEDDLKDLGEVFQSTSGDILGSEPKFSENKEGVRSTTHKKSLKKIPPVPAPKPKRSSSSDQRESSCSNQQTDPLSPSRKAGPKSPPPVAPKPRRSTPSLVSPTTPTQENFIKEQDVMNPSINEIPINPVPVVGECLAAHDQTRCSNLNLSSSKPDSNMENVSFDSTTTKDNISLTLDPTVGNDSVNSDPIVEDGGLVINETDPVDASITAVSLSPVKMRPSLSRSEAIDNSQATTGEEELGQNLTLRRKKSRTRSTTNDEDSADSSDDDTGIYNESYRNSCWIQIAEEGDSLRSESPALPSSKPLDQTISQVLEETGSSAEEETGPVTNNNTNPVHQESKDEVFVDGISYKEGRYHKRSDSTTTTRSESEFKREYQFRRKCFVQRSDSQQEYHRLSAKFYDHERLLVINRTEATSDLGLHILDSHPAIITSVDPGSPAEKAGVKKGQIIISINQVNVLQSSHAEIVSLVQDGSLQISLEVASSDVSLVRDLQSPKVSGFMHKLSNSSFVRNWKKRFFVLRKDNCLYYYKNDQDCSDPLGALPLLNYTVSKHTDTSKSHCFKAEKYGAKTYYFYVDTREEMARWVCAMNEAAMVSKKRKESWMDITSHNVGLPALEIRRAECTGYLRKSNKAMKNWNKRYCVLKDACLYYYKSMNSQNAQGMAHLHGYRVDMTGIPVKPFSFILQPPETQMRTFYFIAENETDKQRWVEALRKSVERWIKVD
ncbi:uncharacterized protein LOC132546453 [Ylistrum balloti]|uniref:uncharacterized protein LOC132546453 n=1 Tax=Ylistrum balloti TaxID=509963 RepID=UPI002905E5D3|nr:uncharacterized protein LOC132546453 [Ylistrum balloti]